MSKVNWKGSTLLGPVPPTMVSCGTVEEPNVLTVQIQHQHGAVSKGVVLLADEIDEVEQHHGNDRGDEQVSVLTEGPVPKGSRGGQGLEQPVFAELLRRGSGLSGIHVYSLSFGLRVFVMELTEDQFSDTVKSVTAGTDNEDLPISSY